MALRHKEVEKCCVGATALFFFYRYHILNEAWPPFHDRERWYSTKLLSLESDPFKSLSLQSHINICKKTFEDARCTVLKGKATHIGRKEGCKLADMLDVPDAQLRRLGHWDQSRMVQCYAGKLAQQGARILAGHGHDRGKFY
jgi:hypothetical protein